MISRTTRSQLNEWAVRDLNLTVGDEVTLQYFSVGERRKLLEQNATFRLRTIVTMPEPLEEGEESDWTPRFPGLSDAESCGEWDTGITHEIRSGTSNIGMNTGLSESIRIPGCRATDVEQPLGFPDRYPYSTESNATRNSADLQSLLSAQEAGLIFSPLRKDAQSGVESPVDFGQLFVAFSFFVIAAALALTGMLFSFSMQQRNRQAGLYGIGLFHPKDSLAVSR